MTQSVPEVAPLGQLAFGAYVNVVTFPASSVMVLSRFEPS